MQKKPVIQYFTDGFSLANKSLDIFFIGLLLYLPSLLSYFMQDVSMGEALSLLSFFVLLFISTGFILSTPVFLLQKQQNKALDYGQIVRVTLKNTKRIILPAILLSILLGILIFILGGPFALFYPSEYLKIMALLQDLTKGWHPISLIPITVISFFEFTPFFFSLENKGLLSSTRKSFVAAFNNLNYISVIIFITMISYSLNSFASADIFWTQLIGTLLGGYIGLVLISSSLIYYQSIIKKNSKH